MKDSKKCVAYCTGFADDSNHFLTQEQVSRLLGYDPQWKTWWETAEIGDAFHVPDRWTGTFHEEEKVVIKLGGSVTKGAR